jgi:hypothetical protein
MADQIIDLSTYRINEGIIDTSTDGQIVSWSDSPIVPDKSKPSTLARKSGFIKATVGFLHANLPSYLANTNDDIISLTTDQTSGKEEGDAVGKMTLTLNNANQQWADKLIPHVTIVASYIETERNVIGDDGKTLTVVHEQSPLFFGRISEISMTNEIATVECGDEAGQMDASPDIDYTWWVTKPLKDRFEDIIDATSGPINLDVYDKRSSKTKKIQIESYENSGLSSASATTGESKCSGVNWMAPSDQIGRLLIVDSNYIQGLTETDVTDFLVTPSDNESIVGHCNRIRLSADSDFPTGTPAQNIPKSVNILVTYDNVESQEKYDILESPIYQFPNIPKDQAQDLVENIADIYDSYKDRLITPTLAWKVPMLNSLIYYRMHHYDTYEIGAGKGVIKWEDDISEEIHMKVIRKCVSYDSNGLIVNLECQRKEKIPADGNPKISDGNFLGILCYDGNPEFFYYDVDNKIAYRNLVPFTLGGRDWSEVRDAYFNDHTKPDRDTWVPIDVGGYTTPWGVTQRGGVLSPEPTTDVGVQLVC